MADKFEAWNVFYSYRLEAFKLGKAYLGATGVCDMFLLVIIKTLDRCVVFGIHTPYGGIKWVIWCSSGLLFYLKTVKELQERKPPPNIYFIFLFI